MKWNQDGRWKAVAFRFARQPVPQRWDSNRTEKIVNSLTRRTRTWGALAVFVLAFGKVEGATYKIMPAGDSITAGYTDNPTWSQLYDFGYRGELHDLLTSNGFSLNYVGSSPEPMNGAFGTPTMAPAPNLFSIGQDKHRGYGGKKTDYFNANMLSYLAADDPDIVLLMVGINDFTRGASLASATPSLNTAMANLNATIRTVVTNKPNVRLIVAQIIPPMAPSTAINTTPAIAVYNDYIKNTLVPAYAAQGKFVTTVDQYSNFINAAGTAIDSSLYSNGINHPNAAGYTKMANTWHDGIQSLDLNTTPAAAQAAAQAANLVQNGGFDNSPPNFAPNSHNINPAGTGWNYTVGISGTGSGIERGNPYGVNSGAAPADGGQMAFLQSSGNGSVTMLSQLVSDFTVGHEYRLTFQAKAISGFGGANPFSVQVSDGTTTTPLFDGNSIVPLAEGYRPYASKFIATSHNLTLSFFDAGLSVNNKVSWIDSVAIVDITQTVPLSGDYNGDGNVDVADYVLWRSNPDAHGGSPDGYIAWRANFGNTLGGGSDLDSANPVPETSTFGALLTMMIGGYATRRVPGVLRR